MRTLLAILFVLSTVRVEAQTHPCDTPLWSDQVLTSGAPYKVQFCHPQSERAEAALGTVNGIAFDLLPVTAISSMNATGYVLYETTSFIQVPKGTHQFYIQVYNKNVLTGALQLGALAGPFVFGADDPTPPPSAPKPVRLVR